MTVSDFKVGDRVAHPVCGSGTVTAIDYSVHVTFDRAANTGRRLSGIYDDIWFRKYPGDLVKEPAPLANPLRCEDAGS